ncbi:MAG TPA: phosphatase PAP2 family protein [Gemmatimonadales bacterium]|nr:phosphatase PAP2 family protein [Gemmatimonadales bacterium]
MRRSATPFMVLVLLVRVAAAQAPYRATWWDGASIIAAGTLGAIPHLAGLPNGPPPCGNPAPCDPASLSGFDRIALHNFSGTAGTVSTVGLVGVVGFTGLASLEGTTPAQARGDAAVFANAIGWTFAATEWVKALTHRSRPVLYTAAAPTEATNVDNRRSFPSGHASVAFAAATSYVVMAGRERLPHRTRNAVIAYGAALGVAVLRVSAGKHFPTDVIGGAALGSGIGWLAAAVHPRAP